jgi:hypothetical protein
MLKSVGTVGVEFTELETMAGTTVLGLLAIKNNISFFLHVLSLSDDIFTALNSPDFYGNTPLHYFALRGAENCGVLAHLSEMGAYSVENFAMQTPEHVSRSRQILCLELNQPVAVSFCAVHQVVSVVRIDNVGF